MQRDEHFIVGDRAHLEIEVASGQLTIEPSSDGAVHLAIDSGSADQMEIGRFGDTVSVRDRARWLRSKSAKIVASVPSGCAITVKSASMDVSARGVLGEMKVKTASGDVRAETVERLEVSSASGDVRVDTVAGDAGLNTASGDIAVTTVNGRLTAQVASGDVTARHVGSSLSVGTASGDVRIGRCDGADISVKTVSGNIHLGLPSGIRVEPDINTLSGKVKLPSAPPAAASAAERAVVRLKLKTVSGDIRIERAD